MSYVKVQRPKSKVRGWRLGIFDYRVVGCGLPPNPCGKVYLTVGLLLKFCNARLSLAQIKKTSVGKASLTARVGGKSREL